MKLLLPELNYGQGFSFNNDIFGRKRLSKQLERIISISEDDGLVIALDDKWGNGKTTFLKLWENEIITNNEYEVIYFDAFKNDYQEDAFLALASAIYPSIKSPEKKSNYMNAAKEIGKLLWKPALRIATRVSTVGLVKGSDFEEIGEVIEENVNDQIEKIIEEKLQKAEEEKNIIDTFRASIEKVSGDKKIIFIIDELDRARPDFSLELLEKIKHIFNAKSVFFILAMNKEQFTKTIQKRYGQIDADIYLNKFIHFWFTLPKLEQRFDKSTTYEFIEYLSRELNLKMNGDFKYAISTLKNLLKLSNCSLRECERCFSILIISSSNELKSSEAQQVSIAIISYLKIIKPETFKKIETNSASAEEIFKAINKDNITEISKTFIEKVIYNSTLSEQEMVKMGVMPIYDDWHELKKPLQCALRNFEDIL
ncbi:hypothetical protein LH23_14375 [Cedecea neteri]|uniref:KAP NTPase domain-containing protein n=1 Tax=Cedecea neteri TaxID=158822 RepID=A0AAN0S568_9ENTR|nr:P-loop NTPase fold protein [Cedecea neteri]AIR61791.1 hypothetical protein LH23_14375 [Cedecea neteri]